MDEVISSLSDFHEKKTFDPYETLNALVVLDIAHKCFKKSANKKPGSKKSAMLVALCKVPSSIPVNY